MFVRIFDTAPIDNHVATNIIEIVGSTPIFGSENILEFQVAGISAERREQIQKFCANSRLSFSILPATKSIGDFSLLALDLDSTLITIESIDELAGLAGVREQVSRITSAAIHGNLADYDASLHARVALLRGLCCDRFQSFLEGIELTPGASNLIKAAHAAGMKTLIISGGFSFIADYIKNKLGIFDAVAHELEVHDGRLTGIIIGKMINAAGKRKALAQFCKEHNILSSSVIAVGDGANDIEMALFAGLGVGFRPKPALQNVCSIVLHSPRLDSLLLALQDRRF